MQSSPILRRWAALIMPYFLPIVVWGQFDLTIIGGVALSGVSYNSTALNRSTILAVKRGFVVGSEQTWGGVRLGGIYVQRGIKNEFGSGGTSKAGTDDNVQEQTYNYLMPYILIPKVVNSNLTTVGGIGIAFPMGGLSSNSGLETTLSADQINLDVGIILGIEYRVLGPWDVRGSIYIGTRDVKAAAEEIQNFKNRSFDLVLLYHM